MTSQEPCPAQPVRYKFATCVVGCDRAPAPEPQRADTAAVEKQAAEQRERSEEAAELERRAANLQSQWTEAQTKV